MNIEMPRSAPYVGDRAWRSEPDVMPLHQSGTDNAKPVRGVLKRRFSEGDTRDEIRLEFDAKYSIGDVIPYEDVLRAIGPLPCESEGAALERASRNVKCQRKCSTVIVREWVEVEEEEEVAVEEEIKSDSSSFQMLLEACREEAEEEDLEDWMNAEDIYSSGGDTDDDEETPESVLKAQYRCGTLAKIHKNGEVSVQMDPWHFKENTSKRLQSWDVFALRDSNLHGTKNPLWSINVPFLLERLRLALKEDKPKKVQLAKQRVVRKIPSRAKLKAEEKQHLAYMKKLGGRSDEELQNKLAAHRAHLEAKELPEDEQNDFRYMISCYEEEIERRADLARQWNVDSEG